MILYEAPEPSSMIIDRYLIREVVVPFLVVSAVLLVIFTTYSLTRFLMDANAGLLLVSEVARLTFLKALISLEVLLPLSLYLAVMAGMGRLYTDSEIYAMRSSGISENRLLRPVMAVALTLAICIGCFSILLRPWAYARTYEIKAIAEATSEVDRIRAARFYRFEESGRTVFIERISPDGQEVEGVFIRTRKNDALQVMTSATGLLQYDARPDHHRLTLLDANIFKRVRDAPDFFGELGSFSLWIPASDPDPVGYKTKSSSIGDLRLSPNPDDRAEFQWRLTTPVSALLLALLAIPLSRSRPRQGRYAKILIALIIYTVYFNLLDVSRTWVELGQIQYIWWVPGLLTILVLILYIPWRKIQRTVFSASSQPGASL
jgi:lipopolysaccharide export system permease protein